MTNKIKIANRKKWVSLAEAAKILSDESSESVSEADVLQLALENAIDLAIYLSKPVIAYTGPPREVTKVTQQGNDPTTQSHTPYPHQDNSQTLDYPAWVHADLRKRELTIVRDSDATMTILKNNHWEEISGLWTLIMTGVAPSAIERRICELRSMPIPPRRGMGVLLSSDDGRIAEVLDEENTEFENYRKGKPALDFPPEHTLAVSSSALNSILEVEDHQRSARSLSTRGRNSLSIYPPREDKQPPKNSLATRERNTLLKIIRSLIEISKVPVPLDQTYKAGQMIAEVAQKLGLELGVQTVAHHLEDVAKLEPSRPPKS